MFGVKITLYIWLLQTFKIIHKILVVKSKYEASIKVIKNSKSYRITIDLDASSGCYENIKKK